MAQELPGLVAQVYQQYRALIEVQERLWDQEVVWGIGIPIVGIETALNIKFARWLNLGPAGSAELSLMAFRAENSDTKEGQWRVAVVARGGVGGNVSFSANKRIVNNLVNAVAGLIVYYTDTNREGLTSLADLQGSYFLARIKFNWTVAGVAFVGGFTFHRKLTGHKVSIGQFVIYKGEQVAPVAISPQYSGLYILVREHEIPWRQIFGL